MERYQFHTFPDLLGHIHQNLFERNERSLFGVKDVHLVNLVCEEDDTFLITEMHNRLHRVLAQTCAGRVSGVNDYKRLDGDTLLLAFLHALEQRIVIHRPVVRFRKVVWQRLRLEVSEGGGIEGILGDGDHAAITSAEGDTKDRSNTGRSTGGEEDILRVRRVTVAFYITPRTI